MKKEPIENSSLEIYFDALDNKNCVVSEVKGQPCCITSIRITSGFGSHRVQTLFEVKYKDGVTQAGLLLEDVKLYRLEFENGDYVCQQDGSIVICAGLQNGRYLFHAALSIDDAVDLPGEYYLYGSVMPFDRLCTEDEMMCINGALMKQGKIFDPVQKKVVDSVFKKDPELWDKFVSKYEEYKNSGVIKLNGFWCGGPVKSQRGELKSLEAIQECINIYEARIQELTGMCDEVYEKVKQSLSPTLPE